MNAREAMHGKQGMQAMLAPGERGGRQCREETSVGKRPGREGCSSRP